MPASSQPAPEQETENVIEGVPVTAVQQLDLRVQNVEKLHDTVTHLANTAMESFDRYLNQKTQSEKTMIELEDKKHKRSSWLLAYALTLVVALCGLSIALGQFQLAQTILTSAFAIGTGASLAAHFGGKKSNDKKD